MLQVLRIVMTWWVAIGAVIALFSYAGSRPINTAGWSSAELRTLLVLRLFFYTVTALTWPITIYKAGRQLRRAARDRAALRRLRA